MNLTATDLPGLTADELTQAHDWFKHEALRIEVQHGYCPESRRLRRLKHATEAELTDRTAAAQTLERSI